MCSTFVRLLLACLLVLQSWSMSVPEKEQKLISVASLLNPFLITALNVWDDHSMSLSSSASSTADILNSVNTQTRTTWKHTTLELIETVTTSKTNCESSVEDLALQIETKSCKRNTEPVKKGRRGRLPVHPEMSAEERTLWRIYRNRQSAAKSRQRQKEYIIYLEKLLKSAELSNLLLNRTCIMYASIIEQLQRRLEDVCVNEKPRPLDNGATEIIREKPTVC